MLLLNIQWILEREIKNKFDLKDQVHIKRYVQNPFFMPENVSAVLRNLNQCQKLRYLHGWLLFKSPLGYCTLFVLPACICQFCFHYFITSVIQYTWNADGNPKNHQSNRVHVVESPNIGSSTAPCWQYLHEWCEVAINHFSAELDDHAHKSQSDTKDLVIEKKIHHCQEDF